jgi:hypothetical protein
MDEVDLAAGDDDLTADEVELAVGDEILIAGESSSPLATIS